MDRAYSVLTTKAVTEDAEYVYIEGIASTPTVDRMGDVVEPMGAKFVTPMPLLLQHDANLPVGNMTFAEPTPKGIPFKARLPIVKEPGTVKNRVDEAIHSLRYELITAVSIGFRAIEGAVERMKTGGMRFKEWEWLELSLVTVPAQSQAVITAIKSIDMQHLPPATGHKAGASVGGHEPPGTSGNQPATTRGAVKLIPRKYSK